MGIKFILQNLRKSFNQTNGVVKLVSSEKTNKCLLVTGRLVLQL